MKKISTIAIAMSALLLVSAGAGAQQFPSRNMEKRGQVNKNDQNNRGYGNDQRNDQFSHNGRNDQRNERFNDRRRPKIEVFFGFGDHRGYNRYNHSRRYNRYDRHDRYDRHRNFKPYRRNRH